MQRSAVKRQKEIARQQRMRDKMAARIQRKKDKDEGGKPVQDGSDGASEPETGQEPRVLPE